MSFKDIMERIRERRTEKKELIKRMDEQMRAEEILNERKKSANERELERFLKEKREESIKEQLDQMRKLKQKDIQFQHNPLNVGNITNHVDWEILRERNMFKGKGNIFSNNEFIHKNNPKLLQSSKWLTK